MKRSVTTRQDGQVALEEGEARDTAWGSDAMGPRKQDQRFINLTE